MKDFQGRVAVVTGAASGIGRALADRFVAAGMKIVLADIESAALEQAAAEIADTGAETLAVRTAYLALLRQHRTRERTSRKSGEVSAELSARPHS